MFFTDICQSYRSCLAKYRRYMRFGAELHFSWFNIFRPVSVLCFCDTDFQNFKIAVYGWSCSPCSKTCGALFYPDTCRCKHTSYNKFCKQVSMPPERLFNTNLFTEYNMDMHGIHTFRLYSRHDIPYKSFSKHILRH